ncbi:uncharacterized protein AB675_8855 [Cyphellophora attinorum]|uniref:Uncharacterized protein n=1 Tax=Cyphellophora attinorum TaxID=1664694 RepID=A0A0N0NIW8_9EURO|nr:uncharacterized protein AB675_8855 [Phialophora attinorum]KPI36228.1 hypothetical protein AB675_8855 [Phialophora attinorum]
MARLISVVVRSTGNQAADEGSESGSWGRSQPTVKGHGHGHSSNHKSGHAMMDKISMNKATKPVTVRKGSSGSDIHLTNYVEPQGITKMVETTVEREYVVEQDDQRSSGTTVREHSGEPMGMPVGPPEERYKSSI